MQREVVQQIRQQLVHLKKAIVIRSRKISAAGVALNRKAMQEEDVHCFLALKLLPRVQSSLQTLELLEAVVPSCGC